jgi:hypothetical protein
MATMGFHFGKLVQESYNGGKGSESQFTVEFPQEICKCFSKILPTR